jgi:hypothetical protein
MACGYDLDYVSDHFLQTTVVEDGKLKTEGGATYKALILPSVKCLPVETFERINALAQQGATVIYTGQYPEDVPGLARLEERRSRFAAIRKQLPAAPSFDRVAEHKSGQGTIITGVRYEDVLSGYGAGKELFVKDFGGHLARRKHANGSIYFFTMLRNNSVDTWVPLGVQARSALYFNPVTGSRGKARLRHRDGATEVYMQLQPGESLIMKTFTDKDVQAEDWIYYRPTGTETALTSGWTLRFTASEPAIDGVFQLATLGSWTELGDDALRKNMGTGCYSITFDFAKKADKEYRLCLGDVRESAAVKVNGQEVSVLYAVPFETTIGAYLRDGSNRIEIEVTNLPANRIAEYDRQGVEWRIFHEINFVSITYQNTRFDAWGVVPSGLPGPVTIREMERIDF